MIKRQMILALSFIACVSGEEAQIDLTPPEQKVVEIHMYKRETNTDKDSKKKRKVKEEQMPLAGYGVCSGALISPIGHILTAKHCIEGFDEWSVVMPDGQEYEVTGQAVSKSHDIAIIHIDKLDTPFFRLGTSLSRGEEIAVLGSPLGLTNVLTKGIVAKLDGDRTLIDCGVLPGNSGGPLVNTKGELVGIVTAGYVVGFGMTHLNIAQSLDVLRFFLAAVFR